MAQQQGLILLQPYLTLEAQHCQRIPQVGTGIAECYEFTIPANRQSQFPAVPDGSVDLVFGMSKQDVRLFIGGTVLQMKQWCFDPGRTYFGVRFQPGKSLLPKDLCIQDVVNADLELQPSVYGEGLAEHLRYHNNKILGIVNGIDTDIWNPATDKLLAADYDEKSAIKNKKINKKALQESLGLEVDEHKMVIGLISRLTNQKGLDLVNDVIPGIMDEHTQVVVLGTGDSQYENTFRYYENKYKGNFCAYIAYNENVAHNIYAGCDALLVPSRFEPCGLTQLIAMRYGAVPIVRETGGLKDTVQPYNMFENTGNGFTFDRYESGLLYDAINRAKTLYFENRKSWDDMVIRDMNKDVSWEKSAKQYKDMYVGLTPRD